MLKKKCIATPWMRMIRVSEQGEGPLLTKGSPGTTVCHHNFMETRRLRPQMFDWQLLSIARRVLDLLTDRNCQPSTHNIKKGVHSFKKPMAANGC